MEAAETPSGEVLSTSTRGEEETRAGELVCRVAFEEYLREWVKLATTRAGHLLGKESLDELNKHPEMFAAHYGVPGRETYEIGEELRITFKDIMYGPRSRRSKKRKSRQTRVEQMRRIYLLCKTPGLDTATPPVPALRESVHDAGRRECWESEVDKLVAWTHSLSFEELDSP